MPNNEALLNDAENRVLMLRGALSAMIGTTRPTNKEGFAARDFAYKAYRDSFSESERQIIFNTAFDREPTLQSFEEALKHFGTSLVVELENSGALRTPPSC